MMESQHLFERLPTTRSAHPPRDHPTVKAAGAETRERILQRGCAHQHCTLAAPHGRFCGRYLSDCLRPYAYGHNLKMLVALARLAGMTSLALAAAENATHADAAEQPTPAGAMACVDCAGPGSPELLLTFVREARWTLVLSTPSPSKYV